ncbi:kelch-like protein 6 isoform X1 [Branchiostoma floridae]|uniref:Kelch-like protein 6 isoform X1 n=2 Tax=Branchiostoma floridae TaxID=7739 RepID=A0A9J7L7X7_BRAFL|nr:kelch-like protein 6 isoform X1 [Branchiostoma floridae]
MFRIVTFSIPRETVPGLARLDSAPGRPNSCGLPAYFSPSCNLRQKIETNRMDDDPGDPVDSSFAARFFEELRSMRSEGLLVDVTLCVEGKEIPCHRVVLSACSNYFQAMFSGNHSESKKDKIEMGGVSAEALRLLVDYAYTSKININKDNVQSLFVAANMLQFMHVEMACEKFLTVNLSADTCMATWALAEKMFSEELADTARHCAIKNLEEACKTEEFLQLPIYELQRYISDVELHAKKEEQVLEAIMLWTRHDLKERQRDLKDLLQCVCFSRIDKNYIKNILKEDKVLAKVPGVKKLTKDKALHQNLRTITQNDILVLGGVKDHYLAGDVGMNDSVYRLELDSNCVDSNPLPQQIQESVGFAACVLKDDVIVTGGNKSLRQAWRYKPSQKSLMWLGSLNKGRWRHGMAVLEGKVYVAGGCIRVDDDVCILADVEVYNERTNRWRKAAPLLKAVCNFGLTSCCGKLYAFGGVVDPTTHMKTDSLQCYDPSQNKWVFKMRMPTAMGNIKACTVNDEIYLVGGPLERAMRFQPNEDSMCYEDMADRLAPWDHCSATVCGREIYITGGQTEPEIVELNLSEHSPNLRFLHLDNHATVQCFDTILDTMVTIKDLPLALDGHCTVTIAKDSN